jgi:hypothetical protein
MYFLYMEIENNRKRCRIQHQTHCVLSVFRVRYPPRRSSNNWRDRARRRRNFFCFRREVHQGRFFFLGLRDMGHNLLLAATVFGPMTPLSAIVVEGSRRRLPTCAVPCGRVPPVSAVPRRGPPSASMILALAAVAGACAATGALLLAAFLAASFPVFLAQHQASHGVRDLCRLGALLKHAKTPDYVLDRRLIQVDEHLDGDGGLVQALGDHLQQLLDYLDVADVVAEGAKIGGERSDADTKVSDGLPFLEGDVGEIPAELLRTFHISDLGLLSYYLGLEVTQGAHDITLRQSAYAIKILDVTPGFRGTKTRA